MMDGSPPLQFLITPEETVIFNTYRDLRHVYTDGRDHPPEEDRWPTTWGDSVGRWEGETLVIDTVSVREPNKYFGVVAWLSDQAHYSERLRKVAADRIEGELTIEDPATLSGPWVTKLAYVRADGMGPPDPRQLRERPHGIRRRVLHDRTSDRSAADAVSVYRGWSEPTDELKRNAVDVANRRYRQLGLRSAQYDLGADAGFEEPRRGDLVALTERLVAVPARVAETDAESLRRKPPAKA